MIEQVKLMREIIRLFSIDTVELERHDGVWYDGKQLSFRSINSGDFVLNSHNAYSIEATYQLDEQATQAFLDSLATDINQLPLVLEQQFASAAAMDRFKRHCDKHNIKYQYFFTKD